MPSSSLDDDGRGAAPAACDILVAGTPGGFLQWTLALLAGALDQHYRDVRYVPIAGDARWTPPEAPAARLFFGDIVSDDWAGLVRDGTLPAVLLIDDLPAAWGNLLASGQPVDSVARSLAAFAMAAGDLAGAERVLTLTPADLADRSAFAASVLGHAGLPADRLDELLAERPLPERDQTTLPDGTAALTDLLVGPAFRYARTGIPSSMTWPRDCLFWGDHPGQKLPRVLDMTGPSRVIAYGPYYPLPRGAWTVRATLAISPSGCGTPLALELHGNTQLGRFVFDIDQPGIFAATMPILVESARENLEIRLRTERGAITGTMGIDRIELIPGIQDQSVA